ncbi:6-bladed beta-propeller [Bacteroides nordii]|uniref:6-bladed beta-propeller n=1 Tax=Bacteroides nordii TaxID=291645 RepID=UPI0034A3762D
MRWDIGKIWVICCFVLAACHGSKQQNIEVLRCSNCSGEALETPPSYKVTDIIKLETNIESFITNIKQMEMNDSLIFILNGSENLYVFDRNGNFKNQIGKKGEAPNEYLVLNTFYINAVEQMVVLIDSYKNVLLNYSFDGKYISTISMSPNTLLNCNNTLLMDDNTLMLFNMMGIKESIAYSLIDMNKKELIGKYFPYAPIMTNNYIYSFSRHPIAATENGANIILPLCDTIYNYSASSRTFEPKYIVETPRKMASKYQIRNDKKQTYSAELYDLWEEGYFTGFNGIYETKEKIILTFLNGIIMGYFIFDKLDRKGNYYIYEYDDASGEIPFYPVIYTYDNKFIASVGAEKLLEYKGSIKNRIFQDAIKDLKEDDNPCLLIYELE